jgi:hypothetical protein
MVIVGGGQIVVTPQLNVARSSCKLLFSIMELNIVQGFGTDLDVSEIHFLEYVKPFSVHHT